MKLSRYIKNSIFIVLLSISTALLAKTPTTSISLGPRLGETELMGSDGLKHHLKEYIGNGQWTTIIVWGPKCPACIEEIPSIQALYDERDKTNINVLGLVIDFPTFSYAKLKQVQQFEEDYFVTFPNLLISSEIFSELDLGALQGTPTVILIDPDENVSAMQLGGVPGDAIKSYIKKQDAKSHRVSK